METDLAYEIYILREGKLEYYDGIGRMVYYKMDIDTLWTKLRMEDVWKDITATYS